MKTAHIYFALPLLAILPCTLMAQTSEGTEKGKSSETTGPKRFWQADLPGGSYIVALDRITSMSKHSYIIDGNISVTEVVIDTNGISLTRFYYLEPVLQNTSGVAARLTEGGRDLLDKVNERTGVNTDSAVIKQYPSTTHAKTVEFRISSAANLDELYNSARSAWINSRGKKFTISGK
ncbi:MAG: hypothetical protein ACPIG6_10885 [Akkermansiaceae bacterium]